jgi:hypothetical protein
LIEDLYELTNKRNNSRVGMTMKKLFFVLVALCSCFFACSEKKITSPSNKNKIIESLEKFSSLAPAINDIINEEIDEAVGSNSYSAADSIAERIEKLEDVETAIPTESGTLIVVTLKDGYHYNALVGLRDDGRLFTPAGGSLRGMESHRSLHILRKKAGPGRIEEYPEGKKALILAPFQWSFKEDLNLFSKSLADAGFSVTMYTDKEVTLSRCRGDYLAGFDVILFSTHGGAHARTMAKDGRVTTDLLTGEAALESDWGLLTAGELDAVSVGTVNGVVYWAVGVPWLNETLTKPFPKSYFHAGACETAMVDRGEASLSEFLLSHGVGGFNGYDASIDSYMAETICSSLLDKLGSGQSLIEASDNVRNDLLLRAVTFYYRLFGQKTVNVGLLDDDQRIEAPYYLIPTSFPYDRCKIDFFAKGHYGSTFLGEYDAYASKSVTVQGTLSNKVFKGAYYLNTGSSQDSANVEIAVDAAGHLITGFKVSGSLVAATSVDRWSIESSVVPLEGNDINSHFISSGSDMMEYIGPVKRRMTTLANGLVVEETNLLYLVPTEDSKLEFTFFDR